MGVALKQAKEGRLHVLDEMNAVIAKPRQEMSEGEFDLLAAYHKGACMTLSASILKAI
jgi:hypothetical protein